MPRFAKITYEVRIFQMYKQPYIERFTNYSKAIKLARRIKAKHNCYAQLKTIQL